MKIGRKRRLNRSIEMLHQKSMKGCGELDIPIPKTLVVDFLLDLPAQQRKHYIELLALMALVEEKKLQDLSNLMVEYYSRYLP